MNKLDIYDFLAIQTIMGVVRMNSYRDYWSQELGYEKISDVMSRNRYEEIRTFLHFANNELDSGEDRFFKIRPIFEYLRQRFLQFDGRERKYAIDEMMIKYKGKKAGSRKQYMPKKPIKWGFTFFGRSGISGFIYDMLIYSVADTLENVSFPFPEGTLTFSGQIVASLCRTIPEPPLTAVFIDNWFNSPQLMRVLRREYGILSLGTLRSDRTGPSMQCMGTIYRGDHPNVKMGLKKFKLEVADGLLHKSRPRNMKKKRVEQKQLKSRRKK